MAKDEFALIRKRMVAEQIAGRGIHDARVLAVMGSVLRHCFIPPDDLAWAYADGPLPIGHGQTISQPYIVALMTELLELEPSRPCAGSRQRLRLPGGCAGGTGSGSSHRGGDPGTGAAGRRKPGRFGLYSFHVHTGDGSLGWPEAAPYNRILVAAAAPGVPQPLLDQLAEGGQLVIPVGSRSVQHLEVWKRTGKEFNRRVSLEVCFVPLRGQFGWK